MRKYGILTTIGLLAGLLALAWLRPNTSAGATFLVVLCVIVANAAGGIVSRVKPRPRKRARRLSALWPVALALAASHPAAGQRDQTAQQVIDSLGTGLSATCRFSSGPRKGQTQRVTPTRLGVPCTDGASSFGMTIADETSVVAGARGLRVGPGTMLQPVRAYMRGIDIPSVSFGAYGVVAMHARPTTASRARLLKVCGAFVASLPRKEAVPASISQKDLMVTIWPLDQPEAGQAASDQCDFVIDHYDLFGGLAAIRDAERQGAKLDGRGPFLIGWSPSDTRGIPDKLVLVVDMSGFESQDSFDSAFLFWQNKVVRDPALWRTGFSVEGVRLAVRDFVDHYGGNILDAIRLVSNKKE